MYIERFKEYLERELMVSPLTLRAYSDDLSAFDKYLNETELETATSSDCRGYIMGMIERGDNPRSVNRRISALRKFYDYLIRSGEIEKNPTAKLRTLKIAKNLPKFVPENRMQPLVDQMMQASEDEKEERDSIVMLLLYYCGLRRAELAAITIDKLDLEQKMLRILGKGSKERIVPLTEPVIERLEHYLQLFKDKIWLTPQKSLILGDNWQPITHGEIYEIVHRTLTMAGVDGARSPHVLRHSFATHLLQRGAPIKTIAELLGHSSIASTEIYAHTTIEGLKESYKNAHPRSKNK